MLLEQYQEQGERRDVRRPDARDARLQEAQARAARRQLGMDVGEDEAREHEEEADRLSAHERQPGGLPDPASLEVMRDDRRRSDEAQRRERKERGSGAARPHSRGPHAAELLANSVWPMPTIAAAFRTAAHATAAEAPGNRGITTSRETRYIPAMTEVPRARPGLGAVAIASVAVLAGALLTAFRVAPAQDLATLLAVQGPRVLFDARAGALRHASDGERPMRELEWLAGSVGAAAGGFGAVVAAPNAPVWIAFAVGAVAGGALLFAAARALDRPHRATNLRALARIAVAIFAAALAGTYVRARHDAVAAIVTWLLGDLTGATG